MKVSNKWSVWLLTGAMLVSMHTVALAEEPQVPTVQANVTKNLELAEGITVPTAEFHFEIKGLTEGAPQATIAPIAFSSTDDKGTLQEGRYRITKDTQITFGTYPHAGIYEYEVKETPDTYKAQDGTMTYAQDVYHLRVYVTNDGDNLKISNITAEKENTKQAKVLFTNTFTKQQSLIVEKQTTGALADKTKPFDFSIRFTNAGTSEATEFVGKIGEKELRCPVDTDVSFQLHDGQRLVFDALPVGARYQITEKGVKDGYTPNVKVTENGVAKPDKQGTDADSLTSVPNGENNNLVGEGENRVTFVNAFHDVPITGVMIDNLPFVVLIGAAVAAFVGLAILKRRKTVKR